MIPEMSERSTKLRARVQEFMDEHIMPNESLYYQQIEEADDRWACPPILDELKAKAKAAGLWNLFLPESDKGAGLTNLEYAPISEVMGRVHFGSEVFNCSAPDTGNMEVLERYATEENKERWLTPLLNGEIRSAFAMTEPAVASSDATNIESSIVKDGDEYVINGRKWWTSGILDKRCKILIFMGKTDPAAEKHKQQSMILVPVDTKGITINRALTVFGYDHAHHGHRRELHGACVHVDGHGRVGWPGVHAGGHALEDLVAGLIVLHVRPCEVWRHAHHGVTVHLVVHVHGREGGHLEDLCPMLPVDACSCPQSERPHQKSQLERRASLTSS